MATRQRADTLLRVLADVAFSLPFGFFGTARVTNAMVAGFILANDFRHSVWLIHLLYYVCKE